MHFLTVRCLGRLTSMEGCDRQAWYKAARLHWVLKTPLTGRPAGTSAPQREHRKCAEAWRLAQGLETQVTEFRAQAYNQLDYTKRSDVLRDVHLIILAERQQLVWLLYPNVLRVKPVSFL